MAKKASQTARNPKTARIRFIRPVKMGGRWYGVGEEASLSARIAREFEKCGLVQKLSTRLESKGGEKSGGRK